MESGSEALGDLENQTPFLGGNGEPVDQIKECMENQVHHTGSLVNSLLMSNFESLFQLVGGFILFLIFTLGK